MRSDDRLVLVALAIFVAGVALWKGGVILLLGVIVAGLLYTSKIYLAWRDLNAKEGSSRSFRDDFLGIRRSEPRPSRRPPRDR
ncbi:MAG: hypothetical protein ABSG93_04960 [Solirubrobacteraceae bacterium]|jgi:hypothetical protein